MPPPKTPRATAASRAREAQQRLAEKRRADPMSVPKMALSINGALHVLLRAKAEANISLDQILDLTGETNLREAYKGVAWLRDNLIIERPRTRGGAGQAAPTKFLSDLEVAQILNAKSQHHEQSMLVRALA